MKKKIKEPAMRLTEERCLMSPLFEKNEDGTLKKTGDKYYITCDDRPVTLGIVDEEVYVRGMWVSGEVTPYPPARKFVKGEKVLIGNLKDVTILEEVEEGIYHIGYFSCNNNYGNPVVSYKSSFWRWYNIHRQSEPVPYSFTIKDDLRLSSFAKTVESLISQYYMGIDMHPAYQRDYVWSDEDKEKLLDSIFAGVNIGTFAIARVCGADEIVDGKQRLMTLVQFYEERFAYKGVYYENLSFVDKQTFKNTITSCIELKTSSQDDAVTLFIRMNTSGKPIDNEVIENAKRFLNQNRKSESQ